MQNIIHQTDHSAVRARTPYHSLGDGERMHVPAWAQHRSVYRTDGRTLYLVETDRLAEAKSDLAMLDRAGWDVRVAAHDAARESGSARIALTRRPFAKAA